MSSRDLFRGTATYYARFRPPYPGELIKHILERYRISSTSRVLDLGCGTGQLALPLAQYAGVVIGMDPEPEMLAEASTLATGRGIGNVSWLLGGSEDLARLRDDIGSPNLIVIGRAFHWMDELRTLRQLHMLLPPGGGLAIIGDTCSLWGGASPWQTAIMAAIKRLLGEYRRAGSGVNTIDHQPWEEMFPASPFGEYELFHQEITRAWDIDGVIGYLYSTSFCSPHVLGDTRLGFERDLRDTLLAIHPDNVFLEQVELDAFLMRKSP